MQRPHFVCCSIITAVYILDWKVSAGIISITIAVSQSPLVGLLGRIRAKRVRSWAHTVLTRWEWYFILADLISAKGTCLGSKCFEASTQGMHFGRANTRREDSVAFFTKLLTILLNEASFAAHWSARTIKLLILFDANYKLLFVILWLTYDHMGGLISIKAKLLGQRFVLLFPFICLAMNLNGSQYFILSKLSTRAIPAW